MKFNEESTTTKRNPSNRFLARFVHYSRTGMFQKINKGIEKIQWPKHFTKDEKDLIKGLCHSEPSRRTPMLEGGPDQLKGSPLYAATSSITRKSIPFFHSKIEAAGEERCRLPGVFGSRLAASRRAVAQVRKDGVVLVGDQGRHGESRTPGFRFHHFSCLPGRS